MDQQNKRISPLARVELEALEAGREWTRLKIKRDLQKLADEQGDLSPPEPSPSDKEPPPSGPAQDLRR